DPPADPGVSPRELHDRGRGRHDPSGCWQGSTTSAVAPGRQKCSVSRRGWTLFLLMSVIWGIPYLLIKVAVGDLSPVLVVFGRCIIGAALLLPWTLAKGQLRPALRHWRALLAFTVLEMTGPWLLI